MASVTNDEIMTQLKKMSTKHDHDVEELKSMIKQKDSKVELSEAPMNSKVNFDSKIPPRNPKIGKIPSMNSRSFFHRSFSTGQTGVDFINFELEQYEERQERLRNLDLFVLDNSMRETTVGQLRGHTLDDKMTIYEEIKKCGFEYFVVESFNHQTRLGDVFLKRLIENGEDTTKMVAFAEFFDFDAVGEDKVPITDKLPIGLEKCKRYGLRNVIMELDLAYHGIDYKKFGFKQIKELILERLRWVKDNLGFHSKAFVNFRDWYTAMEKYPIRVLKLVRFLSSLDASIRPFAIMVEEFGKNLPEKVGVWVQAVRREMTKAGWKNGHLLFHVHEQWGMADITQLECLAKGANGIWTGVPQEGAAMGCAGSAITILNLIRLGNKKVQEKYNCSYLREAAINITKVTTGNLPYPKQPIYGDRALDVVFGLGGSGDSGEFDLTKFVGLSNESRITTLASPEMILQKLNHNFGQNDQFTLDMAKSMKEKLLENLRDGRKEEANSCVGLALLFDQAGGALTDQMSKGITNYEKPTVHILGLIGELKKQWDTWDVVDGTKDDQITFDAFYNGFMGGYFGCYRCEDTRKALQAIDMDDNGMVGWAEFELYLKWAGRQYPDTGTAEELLDIAFRKGLMPAMKDELLAQEETEVIISDDEWSDEDY